jgi:tripartite-type tricarboxylate transporter receptor subunit TctC
MSRRSNRWVLHMASSRKLASGAAILTPLILLLSSVPVLAEILPKEPLHIVVGFGRGGGTDVVTRIIAPALAETLQHEVIVDNKPGGGGTTAAAIVASAPRDGSVAFMMNSGHTVSAVMYKNLPYDSLRDFQPVMLVASSSLAILTNKKVPAKNLQELTALARKDKGALSFGSVGLGSAQNFACELFRQAMGIEMRHKAYADTPTELTALKNGEVQVVCELVQAALPQIRAGELIPLAVTAPFRWPSLPDVQTVAEQGVQHYDVTSWYGLAFPAGVPANVVNATSQAMRTVLKRDAVRKALVEAGASVEPSTTEEFSGHLQSEIAKWRRVRDKAGIQPQ